MIVSVRYSVLTLLTVPDFPVTIYGGTKSILISTRTVMGGKNSFLGIAYVVIGGICIVLGVVFTFAHLIRPRYDGKVPQSCLTLTEIGNSAITPIYPGTTPMLLRLPPPLVVT